MTQKYRKFFWLFVILSFVLNIAPLAYYGITAFIGTELVIEKVTLSATVFAVVIMSIVAWSNKIVLRSRIWILMIGLYICLDNIIVPLAVIAICQCADELIVCPLKKLFGRKLLINKEIDKRL